MNSNEDMFLIRFENQTITNTCMVLDYIQLACTDISISIFNKYIIKCKGEEISDLSSIHGKVIKRIEIDDKLNLFLIYIHDDMQLLVDISDDAYSFPEAINITLSNYEMMVL
ncbi:hypothetical protein [Pigmentibacter ruber]|uniref:hypothetical protein n=1 Tax=Pigmentibacter ruber TaxID=2683196 RepID=UPI00131C9424|nr:hypothetical protein [Pigmentibacter ruber]